MGAVWDNYFTAFPTLHTTLVILANKIRQLVMFFSLSELLKLQIYVPQKNKTEMPFAFSLVETKILVRRNLLSLFLFL